MYCCVYEQNRIVYAQTSLWMMYFANGLPWLLCGPTLSACCGIWSLALWWWLVIYSPLQLQCYSLKWKIVVALLVWGIGFALKIYSLVNSQVHYLGKISLCYSSGDRWYVFFVKKWLDEVINMTTYGIPALEIIVCCTLTCIKVYLKPKNWACWLAFRKTRQLDTWHRWASLLIFLSIKFD